jgi:hypothetical protein
MDAGPTTKDSVTKHTTTKRITKKFINTKCINTKQRYKETKNITIKRIKRQNV